jgi:phosphate:Na+ symporter
MTIFDVLTMIGGLCLFLFGMNIMGDGLERRAGNSLKILLGGISSNNLFIQLLNPAFFEKLDDYSRKYQLPTE